MSTYLKSPIIIFGELVQINKSLGTDNDFSRYKITNDINKSIDLYFQQTLSQNIVNQA